MRLWLMYDKTEITRNQFFIDRWMDAGKKQGVTVELVTLDQVRPAVLDSVLRLISKDHTQPPDCVVMRANVPLLSAHLEGMGIPVFNNARLARVCNDKRLTHQLAAGIAPMMDTAFLNPGDSRSPFPYPVVVKSAHGNGGRQVFLAEDEADFKQALGRIAPDSALVQPLCDTPGRDVRVYMLGHEVVASMMRFSGTDFRSNVGLGADAVPYDPGEDILNLARRFARMLDPGLIGVDFLFHKGQLIFNEIEDAVGTRMLYAQDRMDIVADYMAFILKRLAH